MESSSCCFTGHRQLPANKIEKIVTSLDREIENLIAKGVTDFISGGAVGFDQIAASLIVAKKEMGQNIRLIFALPVKIKIANGMKNKGNCMAICLMKQTKSFMFQRTTTHFV